MAKAISKTTASETQRLRNVIRRALPPVLQKLYEMALEGDTTAAKILIDRALPALAPVKEPVTFSGDTRKAMALEPVQSLPERRIAAQKTASKCSHSASMLRFFEGFACTASVDRDFEQALRHYGQGSRRADRSP